jgi:thiol-disulfide isomerase/thioredoxin
MKNLLFFLLLFYMSTSIFAQVDSTTPPYKKFPTLPPLQILLGDSATKYTKENLPHNKPVLIMIFSPECSHCQHEAEEMMAHKDDLKDLQVVMVTFHPLWQMNEFVNKYKLNELPNFVIGRDTYFMLPSFYAIHNLPFHAMYDKEGNLITVFEGSMELSKVLDSFKK